MLLLIYTITNFLVYFSGTTMVVYSSKGVFLLVLLTL